MAIQKFNPAKVKKDIEAMLEDDFFPKSSKDFLYKKIVPEYNRFFGKFSDYALFKTKQAMNYIFNHEKLYLISPDEFFQKLYETLKAHHEVYLNNVSLKEREAKIEPEDVNSVFEDFSSSFRD